MKAVNKKFDRFLEHVLGEHEARKVEGYEAKDMVDVLLQHVDDPNLGVKIERHVIKALIQVKFLDFPLNFVHLTKNIFQKNIFLILRLLDQLTKMSIHRKWFPTKFK